MYFRSWGNPTPALQYIRMDVHTCSSRVQIQRKEYLGTVTLGMDPLQPNPTPTRTKKLPSMSRVVVISNTTGRGEERNSRVIMPKRDVG